MTVVSDKRAIREAIRAEGLAFGSDRICPVCFTRPKGKDSMTCRTCQPKPALPQGRPPKYSDDAIVNMIREGETTPNRLLAATGLHSKTTMIRRLRRLHAEGRVYLTERVRRLGFTVTAKQN